MIMDYAMPAMNGVEAARQMRKRRPGLPVLFVTGYSEAVAAEVRATRDMLLHKPFTSAELAAGVAVLLDGTPAREQCGVAARR